MSTNNNMQITYCNFPPPAATSKLYTCYKKEACCEFGCCVSGPYQIYQVWYYWLVFLIIFGIISGGSWFCKKPQTRATRNTYRSSQNTHSYTVPCCSRRRCATHINSTDNSPTNREEGIVLDRLFVSFRNRNTLGDPPSYSSIVPPNYSNMPQKFCPLYTCYGPPPTYSSMYKLANSSQHPSGINAVPVHAPVATFSRDVIQIQVHTEGNRTGEENSTSTNEDNSNAADGNQEPENSLHTPTAPKPS